MAKVEEKTTSEHVGSAAAYVIPSAGAAWAIVELLVFALPQLKPVAEPILTLVTIVVNLAAVYFVKR